MHMRTTLNIDDKLLADAAGLAGITEKTALLHAGLEAVIARAAARRLAALGGSLPNPRTPPRRRLPTFGTSRGDPPGHIDLD